jgi:hypothetical protein
VSSVSATFPVSPARTARSLGVEIPGGRGVILMPEGSAAPRSNSRLFTTVTDGQRAVEIRIVACGGDRAEFPPLARFLLAGIRRGARGEARIEIGLSLEPGGMLRAWAAESAGSAREEIFFSGASVYPSEAGGDCLTSLIRSNWPARRTAGQRVTEEIRAWLSVPPGTESGESTRVSRLDGALALQTLAGELASAKRFEERGAVRVENWLQPDGHREVRHVR